LQTFSDHLGREQKVVVVYEDKIARSVHLGDLVREERVGPVVVQPERVGGRYRGGRVEPEEVVEQRPEG
jgi:hypothetical protein